MSDSVGTEIKLENILSGHTVLFTPAGFTRDDLLGVVWDVNEQTELVSLTDHKGTKHQLGVGAIKEIEPK